MKNNMIIIGSFKHLLDVVRNKTTFEIYVNKQWGESKSVNDWLLDVAGDESFRLSFNRVLYLENLFQQHFIRIKPEPEKVILYKYQSNSTNQIYWAITRFLSSDLYLKEWVEAVPQMAKGVHTVLD